MILYLSLILLFQTIASADPRGILTFLAFLALAFAYRRPRTHRTGGPEL